MLTAALALSLCALSQAAQSSQSSRPAIPALPPVAMAGAPKIEAELRVVLSESGYLKLLAASPAAEAPTTRRDSYLDFFDGSRFLLKRQDPPMKIRVMEKDSGAKTQVSQPTERRSVVSGALAATVTVTESRESRLPGHAERALTQALDDFFDALPGSGPVEDLAARAGRVMDGADWAGKKAAQDAASGSPAARLLPAARNTKERRRLRIALDSGETIEAVLGLTRAVDERGRPVMLYELEYDLDETDPAALEAKARRLLDGLRRMGLTAADLGAASPDAFVFTESRLLGRP